MKRRLLNSLRWTIYVINLVENTKLPCYTLPPTQHHCFFRNVPPLSIISPSANVFWYCWPRPKNVVHHSHVLLYYNELCSYTARLKTCQENSIFSVYARFTDHRIVSFQRLESYYFAWHLVLIMMIMLVSFETFYFKSFYFIVYD